MDNLCCELGRANRASFFFRLAGKGKNLFDQILGAFPGRVYLLEVVLKGRTGFNFVKRLGGGQADIARGDFVFSVTEGYLIEKGKITAPIKGATLVGNGPEVLKKIDMVGNDLMLDPGMGMCGKMQSAHVSVGQPTIRVPGLTVGGTDAG